MDWRTELKRYIDYLEAEQRTHSYVKASKSILRRLGEFCEPGSYLDLTEDDIRSWVAKLREENGLSESSVGAYLARTRACLRWLNDDETPACLRRVSIKGSESRIKSEGDLLSDDDLDKVLEHLSPFWATAVLVLRYSGARPTEVLNLRKRDVKWDNGRARLSFPETKTNQPRVVPLVEERAVSALREHLRHVPQSEEWVFPAPRSDGPADVHSLGAAMNKAAEDAGVDVDMVFPYMLRHMRASSLARKGVPQSLADKAMGWKPGSDQWANYTHLATDDVERALLEVDEAAEPEIEESRADQLEARIEDLRKMLKASLDRQLAFERELMGGDGA